MATPQPLLPDHVHLWRIDLDATHPAMLRPLLSPDEQQRATRLRFEQHRDRFIVGRGMLRTILGRYAGIAPAQLQFQYGEHGKPTLADASGGLQFNLAHSQHLALLAVCRERRVGVDLEAIGDADYETVAQRFFAEAEIAALRQLPLAARRAAFYRCWTCKEAVVKALGAGLMLNLRRFVIDFMPDQPPGIRFLTDPARAMRWRLFNLALEPGYAAALVVEQIPDI